MKLTTFLLLIALVQASAKGYSQITLNVQHAPLAKVFKAIKQQTGYVFITKDVDVNEQKVDVQVNNVSIGQALQECFKNTQLEYKIVDKTVVIEKKETTIIDKIKSIIDLNTIDVHGRVVDTTGQPLPGATIIVKGGSNSTTTDANGFFTLRKVDQNAILIVSFIGYDKKEVNAAEELGPIKLRITSNKLDEVMVMAYGQTTQRLSTGDIATISAKAIEEQPVSDPLLTLEGRVPGLLISQASGFAGSSISVQIQGQNSIYQGNNPLYIIDGVPYSPQLLSNFNNGVQAGNNFLSQQSPSPFAFINPSDIESISILKDADATSIYGSRAANGAILITTKKGKTGRTTVNFNLQNGWGEVAKKLDLMNTQQYLQMRNQALKNDNVSTPGLTDYDLNGLWSQSSYTDWQKVLIGGHAQYTDLQGSISGGSESTQFLIGTGYHRETTVFPLSNADQKGSLHFSINTSSDNKKFKFQLTGSYLMDNNSLPTADLTQAAMLTPPNAPSLYNKEGILNWQPDDNGNSSFVNPLGYLSSDVRKTNNLVGNAVISYQILNGLDIKSSFGYTYFETDESFIFSPDEVQPEYRSFFGGMSSFQHNNNNSWIIEPQVSYNTNISNGKLQAIIGGTLERNNSFSQLLNANGFPSPLLLGDIGAASSLTGSNGSSIYKYVAGYGRLNYNWDSQFILNLTGRRDGSSRFGPDNQFHDFWSIGGAWIFSNLNWFKNQIAFLSFGKLSASYGTTGSDQIGDYNYLSLYNPISVSNPYQGATGLQAANLANPFIQWETTKKSRYGVDLGFFKDRITLSANYYLNRSSNELLSYQLPELTGFGGINENFPAIVQNSGWELSLNSTNVKTKDFKWSSSINLTIPRNKLVSFPNLATSPYAENLVIGQPLDIQKELNFAGVNSQTGLYQYLGANGQLTTNPSFPNDATQVLSFDPRYYGGIQNSFSYKRLQIDIFFQYVNQLGDDWFERIGDFPGYFDGSGYNQPVSILGAWQTPGQTTTIQRYADANGFLPNIPTRESTAVFSNASYLRLKNVSLSWQLPEKWIKRMHFVSLRVYAQGQNLLTFTGFKGLDPEASGPSAITLPPLRVMTVGLQAGL